MAFITQCWDKRKLSISLLFWSLLWHWRVLQDQIRSSTLNLSPGKPNVWLIDLIVLVLPTCPNVLWYQPMSRSCKSSGIQTFSLKVLTLTLTNCIFPKYSLGIGSLSFCWSSSSMSCFFPMWRMSKGNLWMSLLSSIAHNRRPVYWHCLQPCSPPQEYAWASPRICFKVEYKFSQHER